MSYYPTSPSVRTSDDMSAASVDPASINTLLISLQHMKERCFKNQRHIDKLEKENRTLNQRQQRFEAEFRRLREENFISGKRVDELCHALNDKTHQVEELQMRLQYAEQIEDDAKKQRDYEQEFPLLNPQTLSFDESSHSRTQDFTETTQICSDRLSDGVTAEQMDVETDDDSADFDQILLKDCSNAREGMEQLKRRLLAQQALLKKIIPAMTRKPVSARRTSLEPVSSDSLSTNAPAGAAAVKIEKPRVCPMCESQFSVARYTQEDFEAHVLAHFQVGDEEESKTLTAYDQYDFVSDASW